MFAKLTGTVDSLAEDHLVLDVQGVGYLVFATSRTLGALEAGQGAALLIETQVGEDHIRLYGFRTAAEQSWFRLLQSVQGVGARVALGLLSTFDPDALASAIAAQDRTMITRSPGVGPKLAQRLVTELRDKVPALPTGGAGAAGAQAGGAAAAHPAGVAQDAISALTNLGYRPGEAHAAVSAALALLGAEPPLPSLIRLALKEAAGSRGVA